MIAIKNILTLLFFVNFSVLAYGNLAQFKKDYRFEYEGDELVTVYDNSIRDEVDLMGKVENIIELIRDERELRRELGDSYDEKLLEDLKSVGTFNYGTQQVFIKSVKELSKINLSHALENKALKKLIIELENKINKALSKMVSEVIAKPGSKKYFFKKKVKRELTLWTIDKIRSSLDLVPVVGLAFLLVDFIDQTITGRRIFHQYKLLYYLSNYSNEELGLSKENKSLILSSIYESRVDWDDFREVRKVRKHWKKYGQNKFNGQYRGATKRLEKYKKRYDKTIHRISLCHQEVIKDGERLVVNLSDRKSSLNKKPAISFSYEDPQRIKRIRDLAKLSKVGIEMISLPGFVRKRLIDYIHSLYRSQQLKDGALVGYFEDIGNFEYATIVKRSSLY
ncbi:MAG: hypothetical protein VX341_04175 [Bdellovibrionota bacterium]|nr:hypothetical protein [Bdellovibrionota bacterium]